MAHIFVFGFHLQTSGYGELLEILEIFILNMLKKRFGSGGIRTHASEETGALNQRLRPLGHATFYRIGKEKLRQESKS